MSDAKTARGKDAHKGAKARSGDRNSPRKKSRASKIEAVKVEAVAFKVGIVAFKFEAATFGGEAITFEVEEAAFKVEAKVEAVALKFEAVTFKLEAVAFFATLRLCGSFISLFENFIFSLTSRSLRRVESVRA